MSSCDSCPALPNARVTIYIAHRLRVFLSDRRRRVEALASSRFASRTCTRRAAAVRRTAARALQARYRRMRRRARIGRYRRRWTGPGPSALSSARIASSSTSPVVRFALPSAASRRILGVSPCSVVIAFVGAWFDVCRAERRAGPHPSLEGRGTRPCRKVRSLKSSASGGRAPADPRLGYGLSAGEESQTPTPTRCTLGYNPPRADLLKFPLFSTEMGTVATLPYNFGPTRFLCTLGDTNLKNVDEHRAAIRTQIMETVLHAGSQAYRKVNESFDHIPHDHISNATARTTYIAHSIAIEGYDIIIKQNNNKLTKPRFNVYAYPPSLSSKKHQEWVDLFGRMSITTRYGPAFVLEQFYCRHCSGRTHPTGLCPYLTLDGFRDTEFPETGEHPNSSNQRTRGSSFRGRGGRGSRGGNRGRGSMRY
ncbi:hypothetical protein BJ912DRAFT_1142484 [Pholiota molesta]|nr:hypothetical protein BJ912DRAFT_1142484 [Pholiota molesta]